MNEPDSKSLAVARDTGFSECNEFHARRVLQCKDIPDRPILEMLAQNQAQRHNWCWDEWNLAKAMPVGIPSKLVLAKIKMMIRRGVVDGCPCGCRGDFVITPKGVAEISRYQNQSTPKNASSADSVVTTSLNGSECRI